MAVTVEMGKEMQVKIEMTATGIQVMDVMTLVMWKQSGAVMEGWERGLSVRGVRRGELRKMRGTRVLWGLEWRYIIRYSLQ